MIDKTDIEFRKGVKVQAFGSCEEVEAFLKDKIFIHAIYNSYDIIVFYKEEPKKTTEQLEKELQESFK